MFLQANVHCNDRRRLFTFCVCKVDLILVALPAPLDSYRISVSPEALLQFRGQSRFLFLFFDHRFLLPSGFPMVGALFCPTGLSAPRQKGAGSPYQGVGGGY